jgi:hypothetical protein
MLLLLVRAAKRPANEREIAPFSLFQPFTARIRCFCFLLLLATTDHSLVVVAVILSQADQPSHEPLW